LFLENLKNSQKTTTIAWIRAVEPEIKFQATALPPAPGI